jgi:1-acyl-sn-glycerol-3-phosphate acyltransferase
MDLQNSKRYYAPTGNEEGGVPPDDSQTGRGKNGRDEESVGMGASSGGSRPGSTVAHSAGGIWNVFARIWAVWVIIAFVVTMLLFLLPFLLFSYAKKDPKRARRFISMSRVWMGIFLPLAGSPLRVRGREKFAKGKTYIVVCNHNALLDVPVTSPGIPGGNKTIAKIEMAKIPIFGLMYRTGSVLVDRKDENSRRDSYIRMKEALDMGLHMCIYPEGTRNKTTAPLKPFHDGAFRLAVNTGRPIMPAVIFNTRKVMPADKTFYFRPSRLGMHFLDPVTPLPGESVENLKNRVFELMQDYYLHPKLKV